ncbi:MAG: formylglycine-generating enzyme family protein, partial [bacterium]
TWAREIEAKHALFLFDSCFSGTIFKTRALPVPRHISDKTAKPVRQFITAGSAGEEVPAESVFLPSFIRAIEGEGDLNRDGYVTGTELGQFLHERVLGYDLGQTPQYGKIRDPALDEGDFVFPLKATVRRATGGSAPVVANIPKAPPKTTFDLGAIQRAAAGEKASRRSWAAKLNEMRGAYRQVAAIDKDKLSPGLKASAWGQFLGAFTENNPYTGEDEELRAKAKKRHAWWQGEKQKSEKRRVARLDKGRKTQATAIQRPAAVKSRTPGKGTWRDPVTGMQFVRVPGGSFQMGCHVNAGQCGIDEEPMRTVRLDGFWLGKDEVTQGLWKRIMGNNPSRLKKGDNYPVEQVSWNDVQQFISRLNSQSSTKFGLPSEAQWEYACRAGGGSVTFGTGNGRVSSGNANFGGNNGGTTPVDRYQANRLGLHDMSGNVWEWVQDKKTSYNNVGTDNPIYERSGADRVARGGGWDNESRDLRCSVRDRYNPSDRVYDLGFRLVRVR